MPNDLAEAIAARYAARDPAELAGLSDFYHGDPGEPPPLPYLVFHLRRARPELETSDSVYLDRRVVFSAYAASEAEANRVIESAARVFGAGPYDWDEGWSLPFRRQDGSEKKLPKKDARNKYVFVTSIEYSARTREPS